MSWAETCFSCSVFGFIAFELFVAAICGIPEFTSLENVTQYLHNLSLDAAGLEETNSFLQETVFPRLPILNLTMGFLVVFLMYIGEKNKTQYHFAAVFIHLLLKIMSISIMVSSICYLEQFMLSGVPIAVVRYLIYFFLIAFSDFSVGSSNIKIYRFRVSSGTLSTIKLLSHYFLFSVNVAAVLNSQVLETGYIIGFLIGFIFYLVLLNLLTILHLITTVYQISNPQQGQKLFVPVMCHWTLGCMMWLASSVIFGVIVYHKNVPQKYFECSVVISVIVLLFDFAVLSIFIYFILTHSNGKNTIEYTKVNNIEEKDNLLSQDTTNC